MEALDLWQLLVNYIFGGFWMAVFGVALVMFVIMGPLGRMSIYSVTWYCGFFVLAMAIGYGMVTFNILLTAALIIQVYFSWSRYFNN